MESKQFNEISELNRQWKEKRKKLILCILAFVALVLVFSAVYVPLAPVAMVAAAGLLIYLVAAEVKHNRIVAAKGGAVAENVIREQAKLIPGLEITSFTTSTRKIPEKDVGWITTRYNRSAGDHIVCAEYRGIAAEFGNVSLDDVDDDGVTNLFRGSVIRLTGGFTFREWIRVVNRDWYSSDYPKPTRKEKKALVDMEDPSFSGKYAVMSSSSKIALEFLRRQEVLDTLALVNKTAPTALYLSGNSVAAAQPVCLFTMGSTESYDAYEKRCRAELERVAEILDILVDGLK